MFCAFCRKEIEDDSVFCAYCGKAVAVVTNAEQADEQADEQNSKPEEGEASLMEEAEILDLSAPVSTEAEESIADEEAEEPDADESETYEFKEDEPEENELKVIPVRRMDSTASGNVKRKETVPYHGRHAGKAPLSGMAKAVVTILVIGCALVGILLVKNSLTQKNAREVAIALHSNQQETGSSSSDITEDAAHDAGEAETASEEETTTAEEYTFKCLFKKAVGWEQINNVTAYLSPGIDAPTTDAAHQLEITKDGYAVSELPPGDYTLSWHAEGYYDGYENVTIGKSVLEMEKNLLPVITEPGGCLIMLEWKGDRDLDLCIFDAHTQKYINILYPYDDGNFLFEDASEKRHCEVIRIGDCRQSEVYTVYVRDDNLLRSIASEDKISMMEREGVSVTVATTEGIIAHLKADTKETSALWCPLYVYENQVYVINRYTKDYANEAWAFYDKTVK